MDTEMDAELSLRQMQSRVDEWIKTYGVRYFRETTNMLLLMEEVGELSRIVSRTYGEQSSKEGDLRKSLEDEMADVLWVLTCLSNQMGVDLQSAFERNIEKKTRRDAQRHLSNPKLQEK